MNKDNSAIQTIGHFQIDPERFNNEPDCAHLPLIATRDFILFPDVTFPISLGREVSLATAQQAHQTGEVVGIVCQRDPMVEDPSVADLYTYGVFADILQVIDLPDDTHTAIVRARGKFKITGPSLLGGKLNATVDSVRESAPRRLDNEFLMLLKTIRDTTARLFANSDEIPENMRVDVEDVDDARQLINLIATHAPFTTEFKAQMLKESKIKERAFMLLVQLAKNENFADIKRSIMERTKARIDEAQRNAFLQNQLDVIREELYGDDNDAATLRERAETVAMPDDVRATFNKEVSKLEHMSPQIPDYNVLYNFLETLIELPWGKYDDTATDFALAEEALDSEHYGLEKVKERILEQIAVAINNPEGHAPILCLVGAPGVGKTSLGESVARAMNRKYRRVSLGGLHDEAEIRGHRRTYIGAMPGRIIDAIRRAGSANPVLLLDEIDKVGADFKGDPSAALLEVLDPEQNCRFHDNYIDVDFDLSKVMFIATANTLQGVSQPLIDRMEVIDIAGYLLEEKVEIARRHLLPRILKGYNLEPEAVSIPDDTIIAVIEGYTSESGVRQLEKALSKIVRKVIMKRLRSQGDANTVVVAPAMLKEYLGVVRFNPDRYEGNDLAGVVTGLAWTAAGGEILYIESSISPAKAFALELTGNLGNVMKESATIAAQWVKAHASVLGIDPRIFEHYALNIHAPEGAIPKDGPSAGITIVTSIVSAIKQVKVKARTAMTGEITLRGRVLPVGGIKEKILAAKRAGITDIILSKENRRDVEDIAERYLDGLSFHYVDTIAEVLAIAITDEKVPDPMEYPIQNS